MRVSVILGHPYNRSFNHAIAKTSSAALLENRHCVIFHDLYEENFNPIMTKYELANEVSKDKLIEKHCREISDAEGIVIIHPNWWGQPPAIMKGWVDRVLRHKTAFKFNDDDNGAGIPAGLLKIETAVIFNTSNTPEERERTIFGDPLETLWRNCVFDYCGVHTIYRKVFSIVADSDLKKRQEWLKDVEQIIMRFFPLRDN
jgi:NAD(P)H dehydrogenase (quinone)